MINNLPNGWKVEKLENITEFITCGVAKRPEYVDESVGIPFLSSKNVKKNKIILNDYNYVSIEDYKQLTKYYNPQKGDILYTRVGSFGEAVVINIDLRFAIFVSLTIIRAKQNIINSYYLSNFLNSNYIRQIAMEKARGIGVKNLNVSDVREYKIPIPPLQQQEKIVKVLDLTSNLIEKQKELLKKYDLFLKSKFIEMFGDPITNPMGWEVVNFEDIMVLQRGYDLPINDRAYGNIEVYGSNGVLDYHSEAKVKNGGVITGRSGTLGKVHYTLGDYWPLNTTLFSKDLKGNNIIYLAYFLEMFKVERFSQGAGVPTLNRNLVHKEKTYKVPLELQNKFASIVEKIETIKEKENQKLKQFEDLHNSMMNKAFKGEIK
ncbi:restriction endonuclease subunit S [Aliarcobacter butzleri]|uniref:restriction endonuclease subunit S n=1 Tax=Aliarcobacter butzleri TaxID=28197 RepID=UPI003AF649EA